MDKKSTWYFYVHSCAQLTQHDSAIFPESQKLTSASVLENMILGFLFVSQFVVILIKT